MLIEYKDYLITMAGYLAKNKVPDGFTLSKLANTEPIATGVLVSDVYWYYAMFTLTDSASRLLNLPFEIGKKSQNEMRSAIRAEYLLYKNKIEPLFDWDTMQEEVDFELPEYTPVIETEIEEPEFFVTIDLNKKSVSTTMLGITAEDEEDEDEDEDVCVDMSAFSFLENNDIEADLSQIAPFEQPRVTMVDYYKGIFNSFSPDVVVQPDENEDLCYQKEKKIGMHDAEVWATAYHDEAMFRETLYKWYYEVGNAKDRFVKGFNRFLSIW